MANKVQFGLSDVHVAFLNEATGVYGTPIAIPGAVKMTLDPEGDETEFYADNIPYLTLTANQGYKGTLEMALLPDAVLATMLGWDVDDNGVLVELADGIQQPFALLYEMQGDANAIRKVLYKVKAGRPGADHSTKTKSTEPSTQTLPLTASVMDFDGTLAVKGRIERAANTAVYDAWYTAVTEPSNAVVS